VIIITALMAVASSCSCFG